MVRIAIVVVALWCCFLTAALGQQCGQQISPFAETMTAGEVPPFPTGEPTRRDLDVYLVTLDEFRANVETYNVKLDARSRRLGLVDAAMRKAAAAGRCTQEEYETGRDEVNAELEDLRTVHREPYRVAMEAYTANKALACEERNRLYPKRKC